MTLSLVSMKRSLGFKKQLQPASGQEMPFIVLGPMSIAGGGSFTTH